MRAFMKAQPSAEPDAVACCCAIGLPEKPPTAPIDLSQKRTGGGYQHMTARNAIFLQSTARPTYANVNSTNAPYNQSPSSP